MPSQFSGLMIGYSGLTAYQAAENTTANNIANVYTTGYSRQVVNQTAASALRTYTSYGMAGEGVDVNSVDQLRDQYLDLKFWANQADVGRYSVHELYTGQIENYFKESTTLHGFESVYTEDFYNALSEVEKNPYSDTARTAFIGASESLTEYFNTMYRNLQTLQKSVNLEIKTQVERVNAIAEQITNLNKQINTIEITGHTANELRDKRNNLIDELSQIVDVTVEEQDIINKSAPNSNLGIKYYKVSISNGCTLVDGYEYNALECVSRSKNSNQTDADGLYDIFWKSTGNKFSPTADNLSGSLKALIELRDGNNLEQLEGKADKAYSAGADEFTMTNKISAGTDLKLLLSDLDIPETGIITISGTQYEYTGFEVEIDTTENTCSYTFKNLQYRKADGTLQSGLYSDVSSNAPAYVGQKVDYQGIPYYQSQMSLWVRQFAEVFNSVERYGGDKDTDTNGYDANGDKMQISYFNYRSADGKTCDFGSTDGDIGEIDPTNDYPTKYSVSFDSSGKRTETMSGGSLSVETAFTSYYNLTAGNFITNEDIIQDSSLIATTLSANSDKDQSDNDLVLILEQIKTDKNMMKFRGASSSEFLNKVLADMALNSNNARTFSANTTNIANVIANQRLSISGVDEDEEALDLVKFQHAYELNSKVIQVMTEIYDRLILETGV